MTTSEIWNEEQPVGSLGLDIIVPAWIDADIDPATIAAIVKGKCASGAYMPAVEGYTARCTMDEHADTDGGVFDYLEEIYGEDWPVPEPGTTWAGSAVHYLSMAVEIWAVTTLSILEEWDGYTP